MTNDIEVLRSREQLREQYWSKRDPIIEERLLWRAQSFRHLVHLLPGQSILEFGCGKGLFTKQLLKISRGENPITAVTFQEELIRREDATLQVELVHLSSFPDQVQERRYDFIIAMDLLDKSNSVQLLQYFYTFLNPGGQIILFESNPGNIVLRWNRTISKPLGKLNQRTFFNPSQFDKILSELRFVKVFAAYYDFVYAPLTYRGSWWLRNLSILLENLPIIQTLARAIIIHAYKPPVNLLVPDVSLCDHSQLYQSVSVVIPCHNEEMNIEPLIERLLKFYDKYLYEIIIVDDNSKDRTKEVVERLASQCPLIKLVVRTPPNGVGRAIIDGYKISKGKFILSMDCDFQNILPELRDLFDAAALDDYDVIIGSRFSRHSVLLNYPFNKIVSNRGFHFLARLIFRGQFRDMTNNLKLIRYEVIQNLELTQPGFAINAETGLVPFLMGYKIKEVPVSWINRTPNMGVSSFKLVKVGGGYWQVLKRLWWKWVFNKSSFYPTIKFPKKHRSITAK